MKVKLLTGTLIAAALISGGAIAQEHDHADHQAAVEAVPSTEAVEVGNKICPVSGHEIGTMGEAASYVYNGKKYNLCCAMCAKDFEKDPEKYSKIADDEVSPAGEELPAGADKAAM